MFNKTIPIAYILSFMIVTFLFSFGDNTVSQVRLMVDNIINE